MAHGQIAVTLAPDILKAVDTIAHAKRCSRSSAVALLMTEALGWREVGDLEEVLKGLLTLWKKHHTIQKASIAPRGPRKTKKGRT